MSGHCRCFVVAINAASDADKPASCWMRPQAFARRLYRFLKRALTLWPQQRAMEPLIALWLAYLAPWGSHSFGSAGARLFLGLVMRTKRQQPHGRIV